MQLLLNALVFLFWLPKVGEIKGVKKKRHQYFKIPLRLQLLGGLQQWGEMQQQ